jgi:iron complex outermembrane receptor protein
MLLFGIFMQLFKKLPNQHQKIQFAYTFIISSSLIVSQSVTAQSNLPQIVVSGSRFEESIDRIPANIQVITKEQIQQSSSNNLAEVLQQMGNVSMGNQTGSLLGIGATPDLGGYGANAASNTLILLNGVRLNPIDQSSAPLNTVPLSAIERIEIVNGGASVQFGNNATGGVINIITKEGAEQASQAAVSYGSFGTLIADTSLLKRENNTSIALSANSSKTNGWRENSDELSNAFNGRLTQHLGGLDKVFIEANAYHMQTSFPYIIKGAEVGRGDPYFTSDKKGNGIVQDGSGVRAGVTKEVDKYFLFEMEAAYGNTSSLTPYNDTAYTSMTLADKRQFDLTPRLKANWGGWGSTIIGYDYNNSDAGGTSSDSFIGNSASHVKLRNQSVYLMQRFPVNEVIELLGGIRRQKQDISLTTLNKSDLSGMTIPDGDYLSSFAANAYNFGVNYRYAVGQRIYAKYDQSYRFANTDDYYTFNPVTYQNFTTGVILRPQINKTVELGGDFTFGQSKLNLGIFQTNTQDEIRYDAVNYTNVNDDNIRRTGISLHDNTVINSRLNIGFGARYQRASYSSGVNNSYLVPLVPQLLLNLRAKYQVTNQLAFGGVINYLGAQHYDADQTNAVNQMPAYAFGDIYAQYRVGTWEGRMTFKNVTNTKYAMYGNYYGSYNYQPAAPRTFFVTLKYNFD